MSFERRHQILELLRRDGTVLLRDLAERFPEVSEMTLRRDLEYLEKLGEAVRIKGGARHVSVFGSNSAAEEVYANRLSKNREGKEKIAAIALRLVETGRSMFLDAGTTMMAFAARLPDTNFSILTSGPNIALEVAKKYNPSVNLIGGQFNRVSQSVSGMQSLEFVRHMNFDLAFLSSSAFSLDNGFSSGNYGECELKRHIVSQANRTVLLLDSDKFGKTMPFTFAALGEIDVLVTDKKPSEEVLKAAQENGIQVLWE